MYQNACNAVAGGCNEQEKDNTNKDGIIANPVKSVLNVEHDYSGFDIIKATQYGAINRVKELIEAGWNVNQPDSETVTLLHWAAINNRKDIIKYFLEKNAIVDAIGGELNATPLHWATRQGHLAATVLLVGSSADPSIRDAEGCSCIHLAAQFGHTALVAYFIARGVNPDLQDRGGMTALMWAAWKIPSLDPVRLLLTLGANPSLADHNHGNTALHWAILARNKTAINTLILKGKASLDIPNIRQETPLKMLQSNVGSIWITPKVAAKVADLTREQQQNKHYFSCLNFLVRMSLDRRFRFYSMIAMPFLVFYLVGLILSINTLFLIKLFLLLCLYAVTHMSGQILFDETLMSMLPLSVYMATKLWFYVTWFTYIAPTTHMLATFFFLVSSFGLWYVFLKSWRGDPGIIKPTQEQRFRTIIELSERDGAGFEPSAFCSACLVRRPLRSKHCSVCDRCVSRFDHHCPWIGNCVGAKTHKHFMGFLFMLLVMCAWMIYGGVNFYTVACSIKIEDGLWEAILTVSSCNPWVGWVTANAFLHIMWVAILTACQMYQIVCLGMTTNERINRGRYQHFQAKGGKSPFSRGPLNNLIDFMECSCFGLFHPQKIDWLNYFDLSADKNIEHEPLLRPTDNFQYV